MKFSVSFISLVTIYILPKAHSQGSHKVPGSSACSYFAAIQDFCGTPDLPVTDLPKECTSLFYFDVKPDASLNVAFGYPNMNNEKYIQSLSGSGKPVFLYYGRTDDDEMMKVLSTNSQDGGKNAQVEMSNLKKFLGPYKNIAGLVIQGLTLEPNTTVIPCLTDNLKIYLDEMRKTFPTYGIGLELMGKGLMDFFGAPNHPKWWDISVLDPDLDFYVINLYILNDCTEDFKVGGAMPINGNAQYTIGKIKNQVMKLGIPKEKTYYMFAVSPRAVNSDVNTCERTNSQICKAPNLDGFCSDNTQTYFDKGAFVKQNGAGFIALDVDLKDDPHGCCQCGAPYPAFHSILAGFNGGPAPPKCPLLDKN